MRVLASRLAAAAVTAVLAAVAPLAAQSAKKPITQDSYDLWRSISGATLSADGKWAMYTVSPVVGEGELIIRATAGATEYRAPRGYTGRPQLQAAADSAAQFSPAGAQFSATSQFAAFIRYASQADVEAARRAPRGRPVPQPRNALGIVSLADGKVTVIPRVRSYRFARDGGKFIAYLLESDTASGAPGGGGGGRAGGRGGAAGGAAPGGARQEPGAPLILRDLASGQETRIEDVTSYLFDDAEHWLAYSAQSADSAKSGVYVRDLTAGTIVTLASGKGNYRSLAIDKKGTQVAFVSDRDDQGTAKPRASLYYASLVVAKGKKELTPTAKIVAAGSLGDGLLIADRGRVDFVRDGSVLQFALAPVPADTIPADSLSDKAVYDLWSWKDTKIQPQQKIDAARDRNRTYVAAYTPASGTWARLSNDSLNSVTIADNGKIALALNPVEYAIEQTWGDGGSDVYLLDPTTAARTLVVKNLPSRPQLSPAAKYVTWFEGNKWWAYATSGGKKVELTAAIKSVAFHNEEFDMPDDVPAYGTGGWTKDDKSVLLYDRYDVWEVDPTGVAAPRNVTAGAGRQKKLTYRVVNLDVEDRFLDPAEPLVLSVLDSVTKDGGFARAKLGASAAPEMIVRGARRYAGLQKARKAEQYLMTQQTYREFPDLWTGTSIASVAKISNANPQEKEYPRGDVELVNWLNDDGVRLQGMLYKPENFDPSKKYPLIVYYYERLSDGLHSYVAPSGRNVINPLVYTSLGYLIFEPDIVYTEGQPGKSALKAVVPGVHSLIARGFVDEKHLGLQGQSWGGFQTSYIITQTTMFAAAVPNATVVNMTSAYDGIRWGPGVLRQFQYEHTQSRIGGSLWQYPERYIENSALFYLDRVTTPVLFMANDADDAVPWYQGIEFYGAMRRLKKEAYLVVYNGDVHNPTKRANQKDIDKKMIEFFGNKLQGKAAPEWMVRGVPYLEKGRDQVKMTGAPAGNGGRDPEPNP